MGAANGIVWTFGIPKPTLGDTPSPGPQLLKSTPVTHLLQLPILQTFYQLGTKYRPSIQIYELMGLIQTTTSKIYLFGSIYIVLGIMRYLNYMGIYTVYDIPFYIRDFAYLLIWVSWHQAHVII